jgi:hypothetical protein
MLTDGTVDGGHGLVMVDARRALDLCTVNGVLVVTRNAGTHPLTVDEVADSIEIESFRCYRYALRVGLGPAGSGLENE